jgi:hypothetical protein
MNKLAESHLSKEALLRWQMGDATEAERTHAKECAECQAETRPLQDALSWFGAAARQWGEEKAAVSRERSAAKSVALEGWRASGTAASAGWRIMIGAGAAVAMVLLLLVSIGLPRWKAHQAAMQAQIQQQKLEQKQQIARDDALLDEVDQDVSQEVPAALEPLTWSSASNTGSGTTERQELHSSGNRN